MTTTEMTMDDPDWRIGRLVTPILSSDPLYGQVGIVKEVAPLRHLGPNSPGGALVVAIGGGEPVLVLAAKWKAADTPDAP